MKLEGKVAIITGAGRGLGRAIAMSMAKEGADLTLVSRSINELRETARELRKFQNRVIAIAGDVSSQGQVNRIVRRSVARLGGVDILVNNAGAIGPIGPTDKVDVEDWITTICVNLIGTFLCSRAVLAQMVRKEKGKIINIAGAGEGPLPNFSAYASSKSAIIRLTETLAEEVKKHNIDVNAIAPGGIHTRMTEQILAAGDLAGQKESARVAKVKVSGGVPLEIPAELVVFLASTESDGLTGKLISAVHDDWKSFKVAAFASPHLYTMRRVDHSLLKRLKLLEQNDE